MATINDPNTSTNVAAVKAASTAAVATDPALVVTLSPNSPALATPFSENLTQVASAAVSTAASGVQKVGVVGNAGAAVDAVAGAAAPANVIYIAGRTATSNPTNEANGDSTPIMVDKAGRLVATQVQIREQIGIQQTAISATSETTIITSGGAGVFRDLIGLIITTAGAAAQTITIKDASGGTVRFVLNYPNAALAPSSPMILTFSPPIPQAAANNNWTATQSVATACNYTAIYANNL